MTVSKTARTVLLFTYVHPCTHITHCHPLHEVDRVQRGQHLQKVKKCYQNRMMKRQLRMTTLNLTLHYSDEAVECTDL